MGFNWFYQLSGNIERNEFLEIKNNIDYVAGRLSIPLSWSNDINDPVIKRNVLKEFQDNIDLLHDSQQCLNHLSTNFLNVDNSNYITIYNDDKSGVLNTQHTTLYFGFDSSVCSTNNSPVYSSEYSSVLTTNDSNDKTTYDSVFNSTDNNIVNTSKYSSDNYNVAMTCGGYDTSALFFQQTNVRSSNLSSNYTYDNTNVNLFFVG